MRPVSTDQALLSPVVLLLLLRLQGAVPPQPHMINSTPTPATTRNSAGVVGAAGGVLLFGPVVGAILGLLANYAAKSDNELGEAARGVGKTALELLNYLNKVNSKYEITNKVGDATGKLYSRIKENEGDDSVILKLEEVRQSVPAGM